jgi:lipoprotein-anchoring transpeptidase ErfK/SrfK
MRPPYYLNGLNGALGVVKTLTILASVILAAMALAGCAASSATGGAQAYASASQKPAFHVSKYDVTARNPWTLQTPFGLLYSKVPRETVSYSSKETPGTIIVDTGNRYLYYILGNGKAIRYSIAVGREGYSWSGTSTVTAMRKWPGWTLTPDILSHNPSLPHYVPGGYDNPLGARALYLGHSLYRIHGTNEPWRIGSAVSSGCIRLSNADIVNLYNRTKLGAKVVVER